MKIKKENINGFASILYIIIGIIFNYLLHDILIMKKIEKISVIIIILLIFILEIILIIRFIRNNIYDFEINNNEIYINYKFKNIYRKYFYNNICKVSIFNSQKNSMHNITFYFDDNTIISLPTSEKDDLRKIYRFFIDKNIECKVLGLPSGRTPEDYGW